MYCNTKTLSNNNNVDADEIQGVKIQEAGTPPPPPNNGDVLEYNSTTGQWEYTPHGGGSALTIYSNNSNLVSNRIVNGAGNSLLFSNVSAFDVSSTNNITLASTVSHNIQSPLLNVNSLAGIGSRYVVANAVGDLSTTAIPTDISIYTSDGTLTGNRNVNMNTDILTFFNGEFRINAQNGNVTLQAGAGKSATLTGDTSVNISGATVLTIADNDNKTLGASTITYDGLGTGIYKNLFADIEYPNISGLGASDEYLGLTGTTGKLKILSAPVSSNIYTTDGSISGNRVLTIPATNYLQFSGTAVNLQLNNNTGAITSTITGAHTQTANTHLIQSTNSITLNSLASNITLTQFNGGGATQYLYCDNSGVLQSTTTNLAKNIYDIDGTLSGNRTLNGGNNFIQFINTSVIATSSNNQTTIAAGTDVNLNAGSNVNINKCANAFSGRSMVNCDSTGNVFSSPYSSIFQWNSINNLTDGNYIEWAGRGQDGNIDKCKILAPQNIYLRQIAVRLTTTPAGGTGWSFTIYKNGISTGSTLSVLGVNYALLNISIALAAADTFSVLVARVAGGVASIAQCSISYIIY